MLGRLLSVTVFLGFQSFSLLASASEVGAVCYAPLSKPEAIEGLNITGRLPIASVSKLMTSHWIVKAKGLDYRFRTLVHAVKVEGDQYDLHFQGSRDPYFGAEKFHYLISELSKKGISKIRNMTFDENFKFFWFSDDPEVNRSIAVGFYMNSEPSSDIVLKQLRAYGKFTQGYDETLAKAKKLNLPMEENPTFTVDQIDFLKSSEFVMKPKSSTFTVASRKTAEFLKEMNRNSNNHAANQIFEHLGSAQAYKKFIQENLKMTSKDILMLNGSGDRVDTPQGPKYNEATCEATLKIIIDLHKDLIAKKSSLAKVATIVGTNSGSATQLYNNELTRDSVVAKTGTVNPAVTLGGMASTQKGIIFFMFIVDPEGNFTEARRVIKKHLLELIAKNGGAKPINGQSYSFFTADTESFSETKIKEILK
jgi:D-alanyl-D-alanine carboxypeptidase